MNHRKLRIFRIKDGQRVPYVLELDHELTVVAEYADTTDFDHVAAGRNAGRKKRVPDTHARRIATAIGKWATKAVEENPIPGTDDLREIYFQELDDLKTRHAEAGTKCPACEIGRLMRKFREKMEKEGFFNQFA